MFFELARQPPDQIAISDDNQQLTYAELAQLCNDFAVSNGIDNDKSEKRRLIALFFFSNTLSGVVSYLSLLQHNHTVILANPRMNDVAVDALLQSYQPNLIVRENSIEIRHRNLHRLENDLALLMPTSGSTGAAKMVALSYQNLQANAQQICGYLPILPSDKALANLPFYYAYGLSVLHSHLYKGAEIVLTKHTPIDKAFWQMLTKKGITSISGVPQAYSTLIRLGLLKHPLPALRYLTQAGGKLASRMVEQLACYAQKTDKKVYVMYGQTEATARMAYLSPDKLAAKPRSIGGPIPKGELALVDNSGDTITAPNISGEITYRGPNVMMGYVHVIGELNRISSNDVLYTGDLAYFDEDGDYYIVGRKSRITKLFGERVGLDELEQWLLDYEIDSMCIGDDNKLYIVIAQNTALDELKKKVASHLSINISAVLVKRIDQLPISDRGKKDYVALKNSLGIGMTK